MRPSLRGTRLGAVAAIAVWALTACGASEPVVQDAVTGKGEGVTQYPLVVDSCGQEARFDARPERVVSLDQGSTEILLSLGLEDRLVGTASWTDPVLPALAEANAGVPRLADNAPSFEAVLDTDPDLVTASFGRHFATGGVAERTRFAETGIASYLSPTDCGDGESINGGGTRTVPLTVEPLYEEIRSLAAIFDVPSRGEALVTRLQARADAATARIEDRDVTIAFWFADTKSPYVAGGLGSANLLADAVGARNVFADLDEDWSAVGWEPVVDRDPQVLVLGDLLRDRFPGDRLEEKKAFLASDPLTRTLPAVRDQHYIALHGAEMNPSIRFVDGLEKIAAGLEQIGATS